MTSEHSFRYALYIKSTLFQYALEGFKAKSNYAVFIARLIYLEILTITVTNLRIAHDKWIACSFINFNSKIHRIVHGHFIQKYYSKDFSIVKRA